MNLEQAKKQLAIPRCAEDKAPEGYFCTREKGHTGSCAAIVKYRGITHARGFNRPTYWLWRKLKCNRRDVHLFDEVQTAGDDQGWNHYLSCDACGLMVEIGRISTEYVKR